MRQQKNPGGHVPGRKRQGEGPQWERACAPQEQPGRGAGLPARGHPRGGLRCRLEPVLYSGNHNNARLLASSHHTPPGGALHTHYTCGCPGEGAGALWCGLLGAAWGRQERSDPGCSGGSCVGQMMPQFLRPRQEGGTILNMNVSHSTECFFFLHSYFFLPSQK